MKTQNLLDYFFIEKHNKKIKNSKNNEKTRKSKIFIKGWKRYETIEKKNKSSFNEIPFGWDMKHNKDKINKKNISFQITKINNLSKSIQTKKQNKKENIKNQNFVLPKVENNFYKTDKNFKLFNIHKNNIENISLVNTKHSSFKIFKKILQELRNIQNQKADYIERKIMNKNLELKTEKFIKEESEKVKTIFEIIKNTKQKKIFQFEDFLF